MKTPLDRIRDAIRIQSSEGNWDYSPYMMGMANGLIFAESCHTGEEPRYLRSPEKWGQDNPYPPGMPTVASETSEDDKP